MKSKKSIQNKPSSARWAQSSLFRCGGQFGQSSAHGPVQENRPHGFLSCSNLKQEADVRHCSLIYSYTSWKRRLNSSPVTVNIPNIEDGVSVPWTQTQGLVLRVIHLHVPTSTGRPHQETSSTKRIHY